MDEEPTFQLHHVVEEEVDGERVERVIPLTVAASEVEILCATTDCFRPDFPFTVTDGSGVVIADMAVEPAELPPYPGAADDVD